MFTSTAAPFRVAAMAASFIRFASSAPEKPGTACYPFRSVRPQVSGSERALSGLLRPPTSEVNGDLTVEATGRVSAFVENIWSICRGDD